jgi:hypothetical protein
MLLWLAVFATGARAEAVRTTTPITLGQSVVALSGPWKFRTGDNPQWATPGFDDSAWEVVDLTPLPGAHDGDVGLKNYTTGWAAKGHRGYAGYAWYRMTVRVADPGAQTLWLAGPAAVDNAYQVFFNGRLIGGIGDFSHDPPSIVSIQPRRFALPRALWTPDGEALTGVVAFRTFLMKGAASPDAGGIHIAPLLGNEQGVGDHYRLQWLQTIEGYGVDAVEPVVFLLLAIMALSLIPFDRKDTFNHWIAAALILLAAARANQPIFFIGHFETMRAFVFWRLAVVDALAFAAWTMAWSAAFGLQRARWTALACAALAAAYFAARLLGTTLFNPNLPAATVATSRTILQGVRLAFLLILVFAALRGCARRAPGAWIALPALVLGSIGLFATELSEIGVPGIWFPWGVGVSRTEYAYAAFDIALFVYLLFKLWRFAPIGSLADAE